jgi:signal transduction histidine kinase
VKARSSLVLYGLVVGVFALMLSWWLVFFVRQGTVLVNRAERAGANLTPEQATAVREAAHESLRMFLFEGGFLLLAFAAGVWLVLRSMRRELLLARAQQDFLSAVTHELRTPLSSARLALQSLLLGRVGPEKRERYLENAGADLERLSELVERALESARVSRGPARLTLERLDLAEFTERTARALVPPDDPALRLEFQSGGPVPVEADATALETILRNLVANARKYAGSPGRLQVRVSSAGREASLAVRDFGPGLSGADPERLFEPFVRGEGELVKSRPGVGLGLYLVSELARALGGRVSARNASDAGGGFEIELRLPLAGGA